MQVITFATIKGGVGKTASACHVAYALSESHRVLFVDMDPQGNGSRLLGVDATPETAVAGDLLKKPSPPLTAIAVQQFERLWVAPAHLRMGREEPELYRNPYAIFGLEKALSPLQSAFDFVVVDTGPHLSNYTRSAIHAADLVMVPIPAQAGAYDGALYVADEVRSAAEERDAGIRTCGFVSVFDVRYKIENRAWEQLDAHLPFPVARTRIARRSGVNKAGLEQKLIFETSEHNSRAAQDYRALAEEIRAMLGEPRSEQASPAPKLEDADTLIEEAPAFENEDTVVMMEAANG